MPSPEFVRHNKAFIAAIKKNLSAWIESRLGLSYFIQILMIVFNLFLLS